MTSASGGLLLVGGRLCLDFCNTISERFHDEPFDMLAKYQYQALLRWSHVVQVINDEQLHQLEQYHEAYPDKTTAVFDKAVVLRDSVYRLFLAHKDSQPLPSADLTRLNSAWQEAMSQRELVTVADGNVAWQWRDAFSPEMMLWEIVVCAVETLLDNHAERLRQCPGCGWLFYDQSRNNSRTWCDMRICGNRAKNKRFHQRQRE